MGGDDRGLDGDRGPRGVDWGLAPGLDQLAGFPKTSKLVCQELGQLLNIKIWVVSVQVREEESLRGGEDDQDDDKELHII